MAVFGGRAPSDALYVIEIGSNDVRDAAKVFDPTDPSQSIAIIGDALGSIQANIASLVGAGARQFLVVNVPNLSLLPGVAALGPEAQFLVRELTTSFNQGLDMLIAGLRLQGLGVVQLNAFDTLTALYVANPPIFSNVVNPCVTPNVPPFTCKKPDTYMFWDNVHPTQAAHALFAQEADRLVYGE